MGLVPTELAVSGRALIIPKTSPLRIVFINGPSRSGKDTAGLVICKEAANGPWVLDKFAAELKGRCHGAYKLVDGRTGRPIPFDAFEGQKDVPLDAFNGLSPRQAYIKFFENWVLPVHGEGALGRWLIQRIDFFMEHLKEARPDYVPRGVVITDAGRRRECLPLVEKYGAENCTLIDIERDGLSYDGDCRGRFGLEDMGVRRCRVKNPGDSLSGLSLALRDAAPHLFLEIAKELPR